MMCRKLLQQLQRVALFLLVGALVGCGVGAATPTPEAAPAADFATFDGGQISLAGLRGSIVVLNFWASWCAPCRNEMPAFDATARRYKDQGVVIVGLASKDKEDEARAFASSIGVSYPLGFDQGDQIATQYKVYGLPNTVLINRQGQIVRRLSGGLTESQLTTYIEELLRAGS